MTDLDNARLDNPQPQPSRWWRRWQSFKETVVVWRAPGTAGFIGTAGSWTVWYYSKVPCIAEAAMAGLCNPGVLASYITLPALTSCLGIGAGFATLTGGYNIVMLNKERQRADAAEERADAAEGRAIKAQERADQAVEEYRELHRRVIEEHLAERQEERRRAEEEHQQAQEARESERRRAEEAHQVLLATLEEERRQSQEARRQSAETHQAMMAAIAQLVQQGNGSRANDNERNNESDGDSDRNDHGQNAAAN